LSSDGKLTEIKILPGIYKNTTALGAEGRYVEANNIRFQDGKPEKMGGCVKELTFQFDVSASTQITGFARDAIAWQNNEATKKYLAVATNRKLEIVYGGQIYDVTPLRLTTTVTNAITTSTGSSQVLISCAAHAASVNDFVALQSVASSVGGISFSGLYEITSVVDSGSFFISVASAATATSAGAGGSATLAFLINKGLQSNQAAIGWGSGGYGRQGYGTPLSAATSGTAALDQWSLDNWGEDLVACRRGSNIFTWSEAGGLTATTPNRASVRAVTVSSSPSVNNFILVSQPSRHLISFGCTDLTGAFNPLLVRWSNREDMTTWDPTVSIAGGNTSGEQVIKGGSQIIGACQTRGEILVMTDDPVYVMRFTGEPFTFGFDQVGDHAGLLSQHAAVDIQGVVYWMGIGNFYKYDGRVQILPCDISDAIFDAGNPETLNFYQKEKVFAGVNSRFNEIIWLYQSEASIGVTEIDRYVIYNYAENIWYDGLIDRLVWTDAGVFEKPYAIDSSGGVFIHETGTDNGSRLMPFHLETSYFDVGDGEDFMFIDKIVPDFKRIPTNKQVAFTLYTKRYPQDPQPVAKGPYIIQSDTNKISLRARGRQFKMRIEASANGTDFEMGVIKANLKPDGKR
jgi:hypothetical protein